MDRDTCTIYVGAKFTVEWYFDRDGNSQSYDYYIETSKAQKAKFLALISRIAEFGVLHDLRKFRNEGDGIYALKPQPDRYLSFFTDGKKIIVTNGFRKKTDKLPKNEKMLALKYKQDYLSRKIGGKR